MPSDLTDMTSGRHYVTMWETMKCMFSKEFEESNFRQYGEMKSREDKSRREEENELEDSRYWGREAEIGLQGCQMQTLDPVQHLVQHLPLLLYFPMLC